MSQTVLRPEPQITPPTREATPEALDGRRSGPGADAQSIVERTTAPVQQTVASTPTPVVPTAPTGPTPQPIYGAPVYGVPVIQVAKNNGLSIAALVCGIVGVVFAFIPIFGAPVGIVLGALATVMGAIGLRRAQSRGMGIAGLVLGIVALAMSIGWLVIPIIIANA